MILLFFLLCSFQLLHGQRNEQPIIPVLNRNVPISNRVSFSRSNTDSLKVELINVDVPGLEIISCNNCTVTAPWYKAGSGSLDVIVKNSGATKSATATVWVEYGVFTWGSSSKPVITTERRGVPALNPGETTKINFLIKYTIGDIVKKMKNKTVRVSLTQNGRGAWREN